MKNFVFFDRFFFHERASSRSTTKEVSTLLRAIKGIPPNIIAELSTQPSWRERAYNNKEIIMFHVLLNFQDVNLIYLAHVHELSVLRWAKKKWKFLREFQFFMDDFPLISGSQNKSRARLVFSAVLDARWMWNFFATRQKQHQGKWNEKWARQKKVCARKRGGKKG